MDMPISRHRSCHDVDRRRLVSWAQDGGFVARLDAVGARRGWWPGAGVWRRTYGRFTPGGAPMAVLCFARQDIASTIGVVEVCDERPASTSQSDDIAFDAELGWLRISRAHDDPKLPGLATLLAAHPHASILRYRPAKRCTLMIEVDAAAEGGAAGSVRPAAPSPTAPRVALIAKVFADAFGQRLFDEGEALWQASSASQARPPSHQALGFAVARPRRWDAASHTLWQEVVPGASIADRMSSDAAVPLVRQMGAAAGSIAVSGLEPGERYGRDRQMRDTRGYCIDLEQRVPWLAGAVRKLCDELEQLHERVPQQPLVPTHGAPHLHQWLWTGERLGLVDFDGFTLADRERDVATFVAEMDFASRARTQVSDIREAFVDGYSSASAALGALDRDMLRAYITHKRIAKAVKLSQAIHPDGDRRAEQAVGRALVSLFDA